MKILNINQHEMVFFWMDKGGLKALLLPHIQK